VKRFPQLQGWFLRRIDPLIRLIFAEQRFLFIGPGRGYPGRPIEQLCSEQLVAQPTLRLEHPAMPAASRAGHRAAQQARVLWGDSQIETGPTSRVLTQGSINDTRSVASLGFSIHRSLHSAISFLRLFIRIGRAVGLDVNDLEKFQASDVPQLIVN
jgi:hypothetical protein